MALITLPRVFAALTSILTTYWDDNFNAIVAQVNGNLDQSNVLDSKKVGGFAASQAAAAGQIPALDGTGNLVLPGDIDLATGKVVKINGVQVVPTSIAGAPLRGTISSTGAIINGTGFTVSHTGTGTYVITPTVAFATVPSIATSVYQVHGVNSFTAIVQSQATGSFEIDTYNGPSLQDMRFDFIAIG